MAHRIITRPRCCVCGLDALRHSGWFLVAENRWLDHLKILSWHSLLASNQDMQSVCCREHLKILIVHWLTHANLLLPAAYNAPPPIGSGPNLLDADFDPESVAHLIGELAVHRESFSRVWSGSPQALECILNALFTIGAEDKPQAPSFQFFDPHESAQGLSLQ